MNVNAVDVFKPVGASPIPADICLVGLDDDSIDEFNAPMRNAATPSTHSIDFDDAPQQIREDVAMFMFATIPTSTGPFLAQPV